MLSEKVGNPAGTYSWQNQLVKIMRIEWLGQTVASICWIGSVLAYGISSSGDWLQLSAASAWLLANIAAAVTRITTGEN